MKKAFLMLALVLSMSLFAVSLHKTSAQTQVTLYAGEIGTSGYGFGD